MTEPFQILVVDDEPTICANCIKILTKAGYQVTSAISGFDALKLMESACFDVVVTDLRMQRMGGMELLSRIQTAYPETKVVVITGYASVASAVEVMKSGAFDYLPKPFTPQELRAVISQALSDAEAVRRNRVLMAVKGGRRAISHRLVGESGKIRHVISMIGKVAATDATVLICGESGTGKELVARAVHANSLRSDKVFFAVDCGTLSGQLLESELFGYKKGAFTGAERDKEGIFSLADKGTVFLDEISNIGREVQGKLLRVLEAREFMPLGATTHQKVDIRLILATNRDLKEMVETGEFREDFYYRIVVYPIFLPSLRERKQDTLLIANHFLEQFSRRIGKPITGFSDAAAAWLSAHDWPGNVRELRNTIERAVILSEGSRITMADLPSTGKDEEMPHLIEVVPATSAELKAAKQRIRQKATERMEKNFVLNALIQNDWNVTRAAEKTGFQRSNFQALMKKHGIRRPGTLTGA